jgi:hypothetical protein
VAALIVGIGAASAFALGTTATWSVKNGGPFTATAKSPYFLFKGTTTSTLGCKKSVLRGHTKKGYHLTGKSLITVTSATFSGCGSPSSPVTVTAHGLPYGFNADKFRGGVTYFTVPRVDLTMSIANCRAVLQGNVGATYTNSTRDLQFGSGLVVTVASGSGCTGFVHKGQDGTLYAQSLKGLFTIR